MPTKEVLFDAVFSILNPSTLFAYIPSLASKNGADHKSCCRDILGVCCFLLPPNVPLLESHVSLPYLRPVQTLYSEHGILGKIVLYILFIGQLGLHECRCLGVPSHLKCMTFLDIEQLQRALVADVAILGGSSVSNCVFLHILKHSAFGSFFVYLVV